MSRYHLTEAYAELHNSRLTEASFYDNLRFVDYLQNEDIEEVMESLIWEFMDYGDTLEEAVDTLEYIFTDDEIIFESLELINEATVTYGRGDIAGSSRRRQESLEKRKQEKVQQRYKSYTDYSRRARRAARFSAIAKPLKDAAGTVSNAVKDARKSISNRKTQLKKAGSETVEKAQAALARVGRGGRRIMNAISGGIEGAKAGFNRPLPQRMSKAQYDANKAQRDRAAKTSQAGAFATPSTPRAAAAGEALRNKTAEQGRTVAPTPKATPSAAQRRHRRHGRVRSGPPVKTPTSVVRPSVPAQSPAPAPKPAPRQFGSSKRRAKWNQDAYEKAKQQIKSSVDYDLLTQYMIEDLIYEGYADTEQQAVSILEDMSAETLTEFASIYLED